MPKYEPVFSFETGTLRLVDGKLFRPTEESVDRWVAAIRPSYRILGDCFDILYQLNNDRFVHVHCIDCQRQVVPSDIGTPLEIWHTSRTEACLYSDEEALSYLVQFNFKIPECLTHLTEGRGVLDEPGDINKGDVPKVPVAPQEPSIMSNRFCVALSFPGEHRTFVLDVAEELARKLTRDQVFYDEWYEVELLGTGGDIKLQSMYAQADLVVPFFSKHYSKPWCSMEWETIRGILLDRRKDDAVIPVHLDDTDIPGWPAVNFGIRLRGRNPQQIANLILQVLGMRNPAATTGGSTTSRPARRPATRHPEPPSGAAAPTSSTPPAGHALAIWREKLNYLQQQEAIAADPNQKFNLLKLIEEAERKIRDLTGNPL